MTLPVYSTGTVSVAAGGTVVTGSGVMWSGINAKQGDFISIAGSAAVLITEVTDGTHLKIPPWPGAAQSGAAYLLYQNYVGRVVGVAAAEDVGVMLEKLHTDGLPFIVGTDETVPDPSYGDEGQLAFKPTTGQWWVKSGGVWVPSAGLVALGYGGTSTTSVPIGTGAKVFTTQTGLAYNGARVRAASAANLNNWMEGVASYSGSTLTMTADATSGTGTFADWLFSVAGAQGAQGPPGTTGAPGGTFSMYQAVSPPPGAADNSLWWETDTGALYLKYNDGTSSQWVLVVGGGVPEAPNTGTAYARKSLGWSPITADVNGPAGAIDNAIARFDTNSGKIIQSSNLFIDDAGRLAGPSGSGGSIPMLGRTNGAAPGPGEIGEIIRNIKDIVSGTSFAWSPPSGGGIWNSISLTAGIWLVGGSCGVYASSGSPTFMHLHADHGLGITSIQTAPGDGSTIAHHLTSNHPNGWLDAMPCRPYYLAAPGVINGCFVADATGTGTCICYGSLWGLRIA